MKRGFTILILLLLLVTPLILAEEVTETTGAIDNTAAKTDNPIKAADIKQFAKDNPWNDTVIISPVWQKVIGTFFGLNLHNEKTKISVTEAIVLFMVFVMFFILIADILRITPFFKQKILDEIPAEYVVSLILTMILSITGSFISLKNLFISGVAYAIAKLNWTWLTNALASKGWKTTLVAIIIVLIIVLIHEILSWLEPVIKKYSEISRAEAKGRMLREEIRNKS